MKVIKIKEHVCDAIQYDRDNIKEILTVASKHPYVRRISAGDCEDNARIRFFREEGSDQFEIEDFYCKTLGMTVEVFDEDGYWTKLKIIEKDWIIFTETEVQICSDKDFKKIWKSLEPIKEVDDND